MGAPTYTRRLFANWLIDRDIVIVGVVALVTEGTQSSPSLDAAGNIPLMDFLNASATTALSVSIPAGGLNIPVARGQTIYRPAGGEAGTMLIYQTA